MLCSAILGGIEAKDRGKNRDDETQYAAVQCLWTLVHPRDPSEDSVGPSNSTLRSSTKYAAFQSHAQTPTFIPIMGQTVNSLLASAESRHTPLQTVSLQMLQIVVKDYLPDGFVPSVLPGIISCMSKIALGTGLSKGWANGNTVAAALAVMKEAIIRAIGDDICAMEGAVKRVTDLEGLAESESNSPKPTTTPASPYSTARTPVWLHGTSSQLHIALNSLSPLLSHPTPSALLALVSFSHTILLATTLTVPQSQPLLLSFLLSLSSSDYDTVAEQSRSLLLELLSPSSTSCHTFLPVLLQISKDNLAALPRLLPSHSDSKVEHAAKVVQAVCMLANDLQTIASGVSILLGPNGGIERWGWSLLSTLELDSPTSPISMASTAQLMLENDSEGQQWVSFPQVTLHHLTSQSAQAAVEGMFQSLGRAAGDDCLFAVDWFLGISERSRGSRAVSALWCACRLLEGVAGVSLNSLIPHTAARRNKLEKFARGLVRSISEFWDEDKIDPVESTTRDTTHDADSVLVEHVKGLTTVRTPGGLEQSLSFRTAHKNASEIQPILHMVFRLQALAISSAILQSRFTPLLLNTIYPILHSLVAKATYLSTTALATLQYIAHATSYASPANLLLSNFDYALDAVSRRLSRRWLDADAATVLLILVRLVGQEVVQKAGDVVEECFDRLDEFHGYEVLVDGLVAVLAEVVAVVGQENHKPTAPNPSLFTSPTDSQRFDSFFQWFSDRHNNHATDDEETDFGPVPQKAWGSGAGDEEGETAAGQAADPVAEPPPTPTQMLTKQIISRSLFFLTHGSATIRARILILLSSSVPVLPDSALLQSIHHAWPFILNRLSDPESFVVASAATLIESLAIHVGDFMYRRIWDDIWPRFRTMLNKLDAADATSALARRGPAVVGTESAYTNSHRLYKAILKTMTAAVDGVQPHDPASWEVILAFRRMLHKQAHIELQVCARELYAALGNKNEDAVWLALTATEGKIDKWPFLYEPKWDIEENVGLILGRFCGSTTNGNGES